MIVFKWQQCFNSEAELQRRRTYLHWQLCDNLQYFLAFQYSVFTFLMVQFENSRWFFMSKRNRGAAVVVNAVI